ncbi:MAG: MraY family glycosyltransferase, partial [Candidatus Bathyarchaeia archaeon]
MKYVLFFLIAAGISFAITPLIRLLAKKADIYDIPSERKIHSQPVPLLGGIPIFIAFNLTLLIGYLIHNIYIEEFLSSNWKSLLFCQIIILAIGIYDDIKRLEPGIKFLLQILVGVLLVISGFGIQNISNPITGHTIHLGFLSIFITILWVVGITNALNLIDGLDGLAAGTSLIASITIFTIAFFNQNIGIALIALIIAGAILGFLKYNFHPAKIFLGDSGSLLLGFLLAVFSIRGSSKGAILVTV